MYSIRAYGRMIVDKDRVQAYEQALRRFVAPDQVVLDIGTGTGVFAMLACKLGAEKVYAIEPDPVIQVAKASSSENGFADRIVFIQASSTEVDLPEKADVIVSDLRGVLPFSGHHLAAIIDARARHLAKDGVLLPQKDVLRAALVEKPEAYERVVGPFAGDPEGHPLGLESSTERRLALNHRYTERFEPEHLLSRPATCCDIDYQTITRTDGGGQMDFKTLRNGTAHGIAVWFEAQLCKNIAYASGPNRKDSVYGTAFFPFLAPLDLEAGAELRVDLRARQIGDDYVWSWETQWGEITMQQSDFLGTPQSPDRLAKRAPNHVPQIAAKGRAIRRALELMDGSHTNQQIAQILEALHPDDFPQPGDAIDLVGRLAEEHSE